MRASSQIEPAVGMGQDANPEQRPEQGRYSVETTVSTAMGRSSASNHARHVYCIDGSRPLLRVLKAVFERRDFTATVHEFSPDLVDNVVAAQPDVIVVDVAFGQESGWYVLDQLTAGLNDHTPVIVTSTDRRILELARLTQAGTESSRAYLLKPFDMDLLLETATQLADGAREPKH